MQELITPALPVEIPGGLVQYETLFWSTVVVILTALLGWWLGRRLGKYPGRRQVAAELFVAFWDGLCRDLLGPRRGRKYLALFGSLFLFLVICNMIGMVPLHGLTLGLFGRHGIEIGGDPYRDFNDSTTWEPGEPVVDEFGGTAWAEERHLGFVIPAPEEPTRNVNVPVGLSLFLAAGMYVGAVVIRGARRAARQLLEPFPLMLPLNIVGQVAQVVSVSFRLFGNIFGGAIILVVAPIVAYQLLPVLLGALVHTVFGIIMMGFLGVFVGVIQAFVFTMLWMTYHAEWVAEEG